MSISKSEYLSNIGIEFDTGFGDGQAKKERDTIGSSYDTGFDSYFLPTSLRPVVLATAGRAWDDGTSGAAPNNVPQIDATLSSSTALEDLKRVYDDAYDSAKRQLADGGAGTTGKSYVGWIAAAVAVAIGGGIFYAMKKKGEHQSPALASANPSKRLRVIGMTGDVNMFDYDAGVVYEKDDRITWEWWHWDNDEDETSKAEATVYWRDVPDDVWQEFDWVDDLKGLANYTGLDIDELRAMGTSVKVMDRVQAMEILESYHGGENLDSDPQRLTRSDLKKRWGRVKMPR